MSYPKIELEGALVAITGAARGIGLATARAFVAAGARVALGDLDEALVVQAAAEFGDRAMGHALDVTDKDSYARFLDAAVDWHGRPLDVLVNNAGVMPNAPFLEQSDRIDRLTMDVNVYGVIHGMRLALPAMVERGYGHVVNVASLAGKFPLKGLAVYNASKFAVVGLSAATRLEMDGTGVSVSTVLPSAVRTELSSGIDVGILPTVEPEDIAAAVVRTVKTRAAETSVPSYVGVAANAATLLPESLIRLVRKAAHDDAAINRVDDDVRRVYLDRIEKQ
ncbi:SDR family oxidoreductase [Nocardia sp. NPDC050413]|uniref:SDR family oxidoreductase n=1 Tax=Nocardia sp. NPDC050413 TaxID=3155784 RepID=UPI0033E989C3